MSDEPQPKADQDAREAYEKPGIEWVDALESRPHLMAGCAQKPGSGDPCDTEGGFS